nr:hypothetical protein [Tanacetum cinerariifolium]
SEEEESQPLGSRVPLMSKEFEASKPLGTRIVSSHYLVSSDSTTPLSPDHPIIHVSPTPTPTRVSFHHRTARIAVRTQPTLSPNMSGRITKAAALTLSSFWDEDTEEGEEDESLDADDKIKGQGLEDKGPGIKEEEAARRRALESTKEIAPSTYEVDPKISRVYTNIPTYAPPVVPVQTPPSSKWSSGSLPISPSSPIVSSPIASPVTTLTATISVDEDQFLEVGARLELNMSILQDHTQRLDALPPTLFADIDRDV